MRCKNLYPQADIRIEHFGGIVFSPNGSLVCLNKHDTLLYADMVRSSFSNNEWSESSSNISYDALTLLLSAGYLSFTKGEYEPRVIDNMNTTKGDRLSAPMSAHIYPTYKCNENCFFCYNKTKQHLHIMTSEQFEKTCKLIDELYAMGVPTLNFLGGEPLIYFSSLIELLNYSNNRFYLGLASNGVGDVGFTEERSKLLRNISNLDIRISLHSIDAQTHDSIVGYKGAFDRALISIKNLVKYGVRCTWSCLPLKNNKNTIVEMVLYAKSLGMSGFHMLNPHPTEQFGPSHDLWLTQDEKMEMIEKLKEVDESSDFFDVTFSNWYCRLENAKKPSDMCGAIDEIIEIDEVGDCYPCSIVLGDPKFKMGNLFVESLSTILQRTENSPLLHRSPINLVGDQCQQCKYLDVCIGGCPLANYRENGDMNIPDMDCLFARHNQKT